MADVKQGAKFSAGQVFGDDAGRIIDRQAPSGEFGQAPFMGLMPGVQGGAVSQKTSLNPAFDILFGTYLLLPLLFIHFKLTFPFLNGSFSKNCIISFGAGIYLKEDKEKIEKEKIIEEIFTQPPNLPLTRSTPFYRP